MPRVLMIRLGAMGDLLHAMPAALSLRAAFGAVCWAVERRWTPMLDGGLACWSVVPIDRHGPGALASSVNRVRDGGFDVVVDLQGLLKSAVVANFTQAAHIYGFHESQAREPMAALFYTKKVIAKSTHIVDRYLDLAEAAGGCSRAYEFPIPPGEAEGSLPDGPFVLANPLAGWPAKQWPLERYAELSRRVRSELGLDVVLNVPPASRDQVKDLAHVHVSGLPGLIDATRRASAVVGLDSGPMHLAAALGVPGVALFGPTDPARNGPVGGSFTVLRDREAITSYKRRDEIDESMRRITVDQVMDALRERIGESR